MIPRHDGLVPLIREPGSSCAVASANATPSASTKRTAAAATVTKYIIRPLATASADDAHASAATKGERRLFTFLPSVDCTTPPYKLHVSSRYFEDSMDDPLAVSDDDSGEDMLGEEESRTTNKHGNTRENGATGSNGGSRKRRRARRREPLRLEYDGFLSPLTAESAKSARLVSTPAAEYSHLACVLLELPASWRQKENDESERSGTAVCSLSSSAPQPLITATPLQRPILQLWGERNTVAAGFKDGGLLGSSASNISAAWGSDVPLRISKKDWKTMDAVEADLHRPTNWSDDDGGDVSDEGRGGRSVKGAGDLLSARTRRQAKEEVTSTTVRAFLVGAKEALRQHSANRTADDSAQPQLASGSDKVLPLGGRVVDPAPLTASPRRVALTLQLPSDSSGASVPPPVVAPAVPTSRAHFDTGAMTNTVSPLLSAAPAAPAKDSVSLDSLAVTVVTEMQSSESRTMAPLMELQKRILKQLPEFAAMNQKMKSNATKQEAITWFQTSQKALRMWLVEHGHTINSDGTVTFGTV
ncbi:hypothetical protein JKF63_02601 [Porcisia hertigi]|uniref:Uncharacterized protein n=1 Tax=Porcisia hertigi TaxID=2761500 RepID=A0A836IIW7_9TRYP|nr:hypothetical protein JKF63_02601 [Porcisia hertigi]